MTSPIDPVRVVQERLAGIAATIGLELQQCMVIVGRTDGVPDHLQAVFTIDEDTFGKDQEQIKTDQEFAALEASFMAQTVDDQTDEAKAGLQEMMKHLRKPGEDPQ